MIVKSQEAKRAFTISLAFAGVLAMLYYDTSGVSPQGHLLGVDLKVIGVMYMAAIILLAVADRMSLVWIALAAGLGVEAYLWAFQVQSGVYRPLWLTLSALLAVAYLVNYKPPQVWREKKYQMVPLYFLGDVAISRVRPAKLPLLFFAALGYALFVLMFDII